MNEIHQNYALKDMSCKTHCVEVLQFMGLWVSEGTVSCISVLVGNTWSISCPWSKIEFIYIWGGGGSVKTNKQQYSWLS
jgi:hypothetical protein